MPQGRFAAIDDWHSDSIDYRANAIATARYYASRKAN